MADLSNPAAQQQGGASELIVDCERPMETNDAATSTGVSIDEGISYTIPTDRYEITEVYDDVILASFVKEDNVDDSGFKTTDSGIVYQTNENKDDSLYRIAEVLMVGNTVKNTKVGDLIVVAKTGGMKVVDFDGMDCVMVRELNIFMKVKQK